MSQRTILVLLLAVTCGVSAVGAVLRVMSNYTTTPPVEKVLVVVAVQDLQPGDMIPASALKSREFPKDLAPAGAIADVKEAAGRAALVPISPDEPVLESKLAPKGVGGGLAALIPVGMRAVCIRVSDQAAGHAGLLVPKNRVDVLFTPNDQGADDPTGGGSTTTLLQNVEILAVDREIYVTGDRRKAASEQLRSVTLLVTPDQAATLDLAQNKGTLHLSLRNPKDELAVDPRVAQMSDLRLRQEQPVEVPKPEAAPAPAPAPAPPRERPIWIRTLRGGSGGVVSLHDD